MIVYHKCKQCNDLVTKGFINEYNEIFCRKACYEIYCGINGYEIHLEKLKSFN